MIRDIKSRFRGFVSIWSFTSVCGWVVVWLSPASPRRHYRVDLVVLSREEPTSGYHAQRNVSDSAAILGPQFRSLSSLVPLFSSWLWLSFIEIGGCNKPAHIVYLNGSLSVQVCGISLLLPPKKLIGNMDREFIAERQRGLQAYLDSVTQHPLLSSSLPVKKFLDPNSYSANYTGICAPYRSVVTYRLSI